MQRDVFLSILAMDSYQRGYAPGIAGVGGNSIGTATILNIPIPEGRFWNKPTAELILNLLSSGPTTFVKGKVDLS